MGLGSILYLLTRYFAIASLVMGSTTTIVRPGSQGFWDCVPGLTTLSGVIKGVALHALLLARAYAVSHGNRWIGIGLAVLIFIYACFGIVIAGVYFNQSATIDVDPFFTAGGLASSLMEALVMVVTAFYAWRERHILGNMYEPDKRPLLSLFIKQGVIRFLIVFLWGAEVYIGESVSPVGGIDSVFQTAVSVILICRFTLDLRKLNGRLQQNSSSTPTVESHMSFAGHMHRINQSLLDDFGNSGIYLGNEYPLHNLPIA